MRKKLIAGNWKMFGDPGMAAKLVEEIKTGLSGSESAELLVCPPFISIPATVSAAAGTAMAVGAQNLHWENEGAFTGEISGQMLLTAGCSYVILGHSERRQQFFETDIIVNQKLQAALKVGLTPIICVGETLDQRQAGEMENVVSSQILGAYDRIGEEDFSKTIIAYEPVWAIGTGKTATPRQADEAHCLIRQTLKERFGAAVEQLKILYGGSVKPANAAELFEQPNIDGGLVGGASLEADSFLKIIAAASD